MREGEREREREREGRGRGKGSMCESTDIMNKTYM